MKEQNKLAINHEGVLVDTGKREIKLEDLNELQECNYIPYGHETVIQLLPMTEKTTISGIILPASHRGEIKGVVAATNEHSNLVRGNVVRLDAVMFGQGGPWVDYINGKPFTQVPNHFIKGVYEGLDLSNWKSENK